ncbi:MAG: serine acetyltransferase [Clostridiales bacterium]|nr:serine acetyltransferase [Clostridiales bacterium]
MYKEVAPCYALSLFEVNGMQDKELQALDKISAHKDLLDFSEVFRLIKSDYYRYWGCYPGLFKILLNAILKPLVSPACVGFSFFFWHRMNKCKSPVVSMIGKFQVKRYNLKFGIDISCSTKFGYGVYLAHPTAGLVIRGMAVIGNNFSCLHGVTIGSNGKGDGVTVIGDNVYVGANACVIGCINIGNNVTVGAGAIVTKDVPDNATVAGNPARILNYVNIGKLILNPVTTK